MKEEQLQHSWRELNIKPTNHQTVVTHDSYIKLKFN